MADRPVTRYFITDRCIACGTCLAVCRQSCIAGATAPAYDAASAPKNAPCGRSSKSKGDGKAHIRPI